MRSTRALALSAVLIASVPYGCGDDDDETGLVIMEWSIGGRLVPSDCGALGADLFEAAFFTGADNQFAAEVEEACEAFTTQFFLRAGTYEVTTRLITFEQEEVASTLFFDNVRVDETADSVLHADFPESPIP